MNLRSCLLLWALSAPASAPAQHDCGIPPTAEVAPFVGRDACIYAVEYADLNKDGVLWDAVLVLERRKPDPSGGDATHGDRPVLILTAQPDDSLKLEKRNDKLVPCSTCGGMCGDLFQGMKVGPGTFTVTLSSGCTAWRGIVDYTFGFSRKDKTWQLVRVKEQEIYSNDPKRGSTTTYTPPKDFGKIDFADFDPDNWKGRGPR